MTDARHRLLLVSSSTIHGHGYLDHVADALSAFLAGVKTLTFVPYALADRDGYAAKVRERFAGLGIEVLSVHQAPDPRAAIRGAEAVFVGGGNTFRLLKWLQDEGLLGPIRDRAAEGMPYVGSSAGTNVAAPSIRTTNDMPIVPTANLLALGLVPYQINPHSSRPRPVFDPQGRNSGGAASPVPRGEPGTGHRAARVGVPEVENGVSKLLGERGARVFRAGRPVRDRGRRRGRAAAGLTNAGGRRARARPAVNFSGRCEPGDELGARDEARLLNDNAPAGEDDEVRDGLDLIPGREVRVRFRVDLQDHGPSRGLGGSPGHLGRSATARGAPSRPEIDEDRDGRVADDLVEERRVGLDRLGGGRSSLRHLPQRARETTCRAATRFFCWQVGQTRIMKAF